MAKKESTITAKELDRRFDDGEDISEFTIPVLHLLTQM